MLNLITIGLILAQAVNVYSH